MARVPCSPSLLCSSAFFIGMLNSFVHIFMYGYYALASLGPRMRRHLWWKRYLTILQLVMSSRGSSLPSVGEVWQSLLSVTSLAPSLFAAHREHHIPRCPPVPLWEVKPWATCSKCCFHKTVGGLQWPYQTNYPQPCNGKGRGKLTFLLFMLCKEHWKQSSMWRGRGSDSGKLWILNRAADWGALIQFLQKGRVSLTNRQVKEKYVNFIISLENPFGFSFPCLWQSYKSS